MSFQREISERFERIEQILDTLKTNERGGVSGGAVPAANAQGDTLHVNAAVNWAILPHPGAAGYAYTTDGTDVLWDQTPLWTGEHSFGDGIALTGASDANKLTIPDNLAIAFELEDTGGLEYLRVDTRNAQPVVDFNVGEVDVDFNVRASGVADAFTIQGSDGQPRFGLLGVGFVQSDANGDLSSAAIGAGDLPAHTHAGAGQGGTVAHAVTTGQTTDDHHAEVHVVNSTGPHAEAGLTIGHVLRATGAAAFSFSTIFDAVNPASIDAGDAAVVGAAAFAANRAHQHAVTSTSDGATNPSTLLQSNANGQLTVDDLFVPNGGVVGISGNERFIFDASGHISVQGANFGIDTTVSLTNWDATWSVLRIGDQSAIANNPNTGAYFGTNLYFDGADFRYIESDFAALYDQTGGEHRWRYAASGVAGNIASLSTAMTIDTTGFVGIGITTPITKSHVYVDNAIVDTSAASQLTLEQDGAGDAALDLLLTGARRWRLAIDNNDSDKFKIAPANTLASTVLTIDTSGNVGVGITAPLAKTHIDQSDNVANIPALTIDQGDFSEQCINVRSDGADRDIHILTVDVTETPFLDWDNSEDSLLYGVNTSKTATLTDVLTLRQTSSGAVQPLFGSNISFELEDNAGALQQTAEITSMWSAPAAATLSPMLRMSTFPKGARGPGYCAFWTYPDVAGAAITVIPNGAGDVTGFFWARFVLVESAGGTATSTTIGGLAPGAGAYTLYTDGVETFTLTVAVNGAVTVIRTAGAETADIALWMVWI